MAGTKKKTAKPKTAGRKASCPRHKRTDTSRRLSFGQSEFLIVCAARFCTPDETARQWNERWPESPVPDRSTIYRYRPPEVLKRPRWAAIFHRERERFLEDCDNLPFSHRKLRYRALCQLAGKLYAMLEDPPTVAPTWADILGLAPAWAREIRQEVGTKTERGFIRRTVPSQADIRREFYQVLDQIEQMVGSRGTALKRQEAVRIRIPAGTSRRTAAQIAAEALAAAEAKGGSDG